MCDATPVQPVARINTTPVEPLRVAITTKALRRQLREQALSELRKDSDSYSDNYSITSNQKPTKRQSGQRVQIKPKYYSGQNPSFNLEDFNEYLNQQNRYYDWSQMEFVEHALVCLTGPALNCVSENDLPITTWKQLRILLHKTLEPDGSEIKYLHQLKTMYLRKDESLSSYTDRIRRIGKLAYPDIELLPRENMLVTIFTTGLNITDVTKAIAFQQVQTLNEALRVAASDPTPVDIPSGDPPIAIKTALKKPTVQIAQVSDDQVDNLTDKISSIVMQAVGARESSAPQNRYRRDQTPPARQYYESREARDPTPPPRRYSYESREANISTPHNRQNYGEHRSPGPSYNNRSRERSQSPGPGYRGRDNNQSTRPAYKTRPRSTSVDRRAVCYKCRGAGHVIKDCASEHWYEYNRYGELIISPDKQDKNYPNANGAPPRSGAAPRQ
jgi:hypothetical protein